LQIAGAVLVHPSGQAAQSVFSGLQVISRRRLSGPFGVCSGQNPVQKMVDDIFAGYGGIGCITKGEESAAVVPGAVGVPHQR